MPHLSKSARAYESMSEPSYFAREGTVTTTIGIFGPSKPPGMGPDLLRVLWVKQAGFVQNAVVLFWPRRKRLCL